MNKKAVKEIMDKIGTVLKDYGYGIDEVDVKDEEIDIRIIPVILRKPKMNIIDNIKTVGGKRIK